MSRPVAAVASTLFFLVGPVLEVGVGPWVLTGWETGEGLPAATAVRIVGALLVAAGLAVIVHAFWRFVGEGLGTPSPAAPTHRLVRAGAYRHVRNPMYLATATAIAGQGLLLAQPILLVAAAVFLAALASLVRLVEEPALARRFGAEYDAYCAAVPGWWPRLRPWQPAGR